MWHVWLADDSNPGFWSAWPGDWRDTWRDEFSQYDGLELHECPSIRSRACQGIIADAQRIQAAGNDVALVTDARWTHADPPELAGYQFAIAFLGGVEFGDRRRAVVYSQSPTVGVSVPPNLAAIYATADRSVLHAICRFIKTGQRVNSVQVTRWAEHVIRCRTNLLWAISELEKGREADARRVLSRCNASGFGAPNREDPAWVAQEVVGLVPRLAATMLPDLMEVAARWTGSPWLNQNEILAPADRDEVARQLLQVRKDIDLVDGFLRLCRTEASWDQERRTLSHDILPELFALLGPTAGLRRDSDSAIELFRASLAGLTTAKQDVRDRASEARRRWLSGEPSVSRRVELLFRDPEACRSDARVPEVQDAIRVLDGFFNDLEQFLSLPADAPERAATSLRLAIAARNLLSGLSSLGVM